jgi:hypothetical protein
VRPALVDDAPEEGPAAEAGRGAVAEVERGRDEAAHRARLGPPRLGARRLRRLHRLEQEHRRTLEDDSCRCFLR